MRTENYRQKLCARLKKWGNLPWFQGRPFKALVGLVLLLGVALLAWLLFHPRPADEAWERIMQKGVMRVGLDPSYPPFEYENETTGEPEGFDVELAQALAERLGVEVQFVVLGFDGLYDALKMGQCDVVISALPYDPLWTQDVLYSTPYFEAGIYLVVREGEEAIKEPGDLKGRSVAVEMGSTADLEARRLQLRLGKLIIKPYPTPSDALAALKRGEADAALIDAISAYQFMGQQGGIKLIGEPILKDPYVIAVDKKSAILLEAVNSALLQMKEEGFLEGLMEKYFGVRIKPVQ